MAHRDHHADPVTALRERAPGKVNLSLLVGPLAADGYHPLLTVFAPLDVCDELEFDLEVACPGTPRRGELLVECPGVPVETNLVTRALRAVEIATECRLAGIVRVTKRLPVGAGLGGGSSDAALTLRVAARQVVEAGGPPVDAARLRRMARDLGADVAFFLDPSSALARGVGDILEPLPLPPVPLVLVLPEAELSTAEVYRTFDGVAVRESQAAFEARCRRAEQEWRALSIAWASKEVDAAWACMHVAGLLQNDLERASMHILPQIATRKSLLEKRGVLGASMSGSGPTVFGVCSSIVEAESLARDLREVGSRALAALAAGPRETEPTRSGR